MKNIIKLGKDVVISDPCYSNPTWCQEILHNVLPGDYVASVEYLDEGEWGVRVGSLQAIHVDHVNIENHKWKRYSSNIGVDSGQAGIFSLETYRKDEHPIENGPYEFIYTPWKEDGGEKWYEKMCQRTLGSESFGVYDQGCVSSSGYGDGSYELFVIEQDGNVVGMKIEFIGEDNEEEEYEE